MEEQKAIFATTLTVDDPETKKPIELEIWKDPSSGAMFGIDATYLDQISDAIRSPFNEDVRLVLDEHTAHAAQTPVKAFTRAELLTILEAARTALADADIFDGIAEQMDVSDSELSRLREKLTSYLNA